MKYLSSSQVLLLHSMTIDETGGLHGLRDSYAFLSLIELPRQKAFGQELYRNLFVKAAVYARGIIKNHPFIDGNKRTAMVAVGVFLEQNGYKIDAEEGEIERYALTIATESKITLKHIAPWLKKHSQRIKK